MRIETHGSRSVRRHLKRDARHAAILCPLPDPVCSRQCPNYKPSDGCNGFCPAAGRELSTDPGSPIEPKIVPLVFELKRTGVFHPCWSCEGHNDRDGHLLKIPRVWFYARSVVHLRALGETVKRLVIGPHLSARWHIAVTYSDPQNPDTTFSLEPSYEGKMLELAGLQHDATVIAQSLCWNFRDACERLRHTQA